MSDSENEVRACRALLSDAAEAFRQGREARGCDWLAQFNDRFLPLATRGDIPLPMEVLAQATRELLAAQTRGDFLYVADLLEYVLAPSLSACAGPNDHGA